MANINRQFERMSNWSGGEKDVDIDTGEEYWVEEFSSNGEQHIRRTNINDPSDCHVESTGSSWPGGNYRRVSDGPYPTNGDRVWEWETSDEKNRENDIDDIQTPSYKAASSYSSYNSSRGESGSFLNEYGIPLNVFLSVSAFIGISLLILFVNIGRILSPPNSPQQQGIREDAADRVRIGERYVGDRTCSSLTYLNTGEIINVSLSAK